MLQRLRSVAQESEAGTGASGSPGWESLRDQFSAAAESRLQSWAGLEGEEMSILQVSCSVKPFADGPHEWVPIQPDNYLRGLVLPRRKMLRSHCGMHSSHLTTARGHGCSLRLVR